MKTILVPVDLSKATPRVCQAACNLARLIGGRIRFLHVVQPLPVSISEYDAFGAADIARAMAAMERSAARKLRTLARRYARRVRIEVVQVTGEPARTILAQAAALKPAYIVMGSHGHGAMFDLIVGSTAHVVLRKVRCPVLLIPVNPR